MKVLDLRCAQDHAFEGWFAGEADFQDQLQRGAVQCPLCGDSQVHKVLSAPRLHLGARPPSPLPATTDTSVEHAAPADSAGQTAELPSRPQSTTPERAWLQWARSVVAQTQDVGPQFAQEARRMHHGEAPERAIRGQASVQEAVQLLEEGIAVLPLLLPDSVKHTLQ